MKKWINIVVTVFLLNVSILNVFASASFNATASPVLSSIAEDSTGNSGTLVSDLVNGNITSSGSDYGIALIAQTGEGSWEVQFSGSSTWWSAGVISDTQSVLLRSIDKIRYIPNTDFNGTATVTYRAWDTTNIGSLSNFGIGTNTKYNLLDLNNAVLPEYSQDTQTAGITVSAVNDKPQILFQGSGKVLNFDGNTNVKLPTLSLTGNLTFEAWVYNRNPYLAWHRLFDYGNGAPSDNIMVGYYGNTGTMFLHSYNGGTTSEIRTSDVFPQNTWVHVEVTIDAIGAARIYWDGVLKASGNVNPISNVSRTNNYLGRSNWAQDAYFNGLMKDVRFWNVVRTQTEIANNKDRFLTGSEAGLVGYLPLNDASGYVANDLVGSAYEGQILAAGDVALTTDPWVVDTNSPYSITINEDTNSGSLLVNQISILDVDAEENISNQITVDLEVSHGILNINTSNITITSGSNGSASLSIRGTYANVNTALSSLIYTPNAHYFGLDRLEINVSDEGNYGTGGTLSNTRYLDINILPVNDLPTISNIANQVVDIGLSTSALPFTIGDIETSTSNLVLSVLSSNSSVIDVNDIVLGGSSANRTIQVGPVLSSGISTITITVTDEANASTSTTFTVGTYVPVQVVASPTLTNPEPIPNTGLAQPMSLMIVLGSSLLLLTRQKKINQ